MFKDIDINSKSELEPYFKLVDYKASEYCFSTIYMWRHLFNTKCYIENDFAIILFISDVMTSFHATLTFNGNEFVFLQVISC